MKVLVVGASGAIGTKNYGDIYRLWSARGPEGIIVELAARIG